jgi:hypothetical protein
MHCAALRYAAHQFRRRDALHLNRHLEAWVGFPALERDVPRVEGHWMHKDCVSGQIAGLFDSPRLVLWRGEAVLSALLRD